MESATTSHHPNTNQTQTIFPFPTDDMTPSSQLASSAAPTESDQEHEKKGGVKDQALALANDGTPLAANGGALASRLSYDTGHGDFCFSRLVDWKKKEFDPTNEEQRMWCMGITGSNGVPVVELGGFQRSGPFPFFKLPLEVRERIYKLLLGPFYECHESIKKSYITVALERDKRFILELWDNEMTFEESLKRFHLSGRDLSQREMTPEEYRIKEAEYYKRKTSWRHGVTPHPSRTGEYELSVYPRREQGAGGDYDENKDWLFIEWIRQTSNVSLQFRKELGDVFWTRTSIRSADSYDGITMWLLPEFLNERPAVHSGVKYLYFDLWIDWYECAISLRSGRFESWCEFISTTLKLEKLAFFITVEKENAKPLSLGQGMFACLVSSRKLHVTRSFEVYVSILGDSESDPEGTESKELYKLAKKCQSQVQELMMPDTLRQSPAEMELYLQSREQYHRRSPSPIPQTFLIM